MDFKTAELKVQHMARNGDFKGITKLVQRLGAEGMDPALLPLLGQYTEAAALNIGGRKSFKPWYLD